MHHSYQLSNCVWIPSKQLGYTIWSWQFVTTHFYGSVPKTSTDVTIWKHHKTSVRNSSSQLDHVTPAHMQERADIVPQKRICREGLEPSWSIMQLKDNINLRSVNAKFGKRQRSFPSLTQLLMLTPFITYQRIFPSWLVKFLLGLWAIKFED